VTVESTRVYYYITRILKNYLAIMKKKLTLTIEKSVTEQAKRLARREGTSISQWVEDLLREKTAGFSDWSPEPGSWTDQMLGSATLPENATEDYRTLKEKEILKKYGR